MSGREYRVAQGGLFHVQKVTYSRETEALIRDLIRESKLSIFQRRKVEESVKKGEPLPLPPSKTARGLTRRNRKADEEHIQYLIPRRRKQTQIQKTGAYERDQFVPCYDKPNHTTEKSKLQEIMAFGKTLKKNKSKNKFMSDDESEIEKDYDKKKDELSFLKEALKEAYEEIDDRQKFLEDMITLGEGKNYKEIIDQEVAEKLRLVARIEKNIQKLNKEKVN